MHRLATIPGGWNPDFEGVVFVEQTPAPIVLLSAADTDIQTLGACLPHLSPQFPAVRVANILQLQQQLSIDTYGDQILTQAKVIILRLLGGRSYWSYGLEVVKQIVESTQGALWVLPGDDCFDDNLCSHSTVSLSSVKQLWRYFAEGGVTNYRRGLEFVSDICLGTDFAPLPPEVVPRVGVYPFSHQATDNLPQVGVIFYRSHYLAGNTAPVDALIQALSQRNLKPVPVFISSLRDPQVQSELVSLLKDASVILNSTSFSLAKIDSNDEAELWQKLNLPVLQIIFSSSTYQQWQSSLAGLTPKDVGMNVALPEVDGRIITRAVSFKSVQHYNDALETEVVVYQPETSRLNFVADLAFNWAKLKYTPVSEKKIALILANYPNRDGRLANGVGLDTPASCLEILKALKIQGYLVENIPTTVEDLIDRLTKGVTNDLESRHIREVYQELSAEDYREYFSTLPEKVQQQMLARWTDLPNSSIPIAGINLGNVFVGIQPSRGYDLDPTFNYHAPDLEPSHYYLAYYYWLREKYQAVGFVHIGKHGNLEWLPGKSIALSEECFPEIALGAVPNFYPFIVNDPGEGSQAKRRAQAVIIDHLTPPLTRAELYGDLQKLEGLIDEYYEAENLEPRRLPLLRDKIKDLVEKSNLNKDLGLGDLNSLEEFLNKADGYLCELKEAQIRDGLHIFGQCPQGKQLRDLTIAIARHPSLNRLGLIKAIALDLGLDFDPQSAIGNQELANKSDLLPDCRTLGDVLEVLEEKAGILVSSLIEEISGISPPRLFEERGPGGEEINQKSKTYSFKETLTQELEWIKTKLLPSLLATSQEITNLMAGLGGEYVKAGPSGAPTRGKPEVLPTGRNFYAVDIRAIPTETAWDVGRKAAEGVVERYTQDNGEYPQSLAISIWGTSTMRTGGDDVAEVLALLGAQPIWDGVSRRVVGFEIIPVSVLGRPRVDVTVRASGFFRDSFPNLLELLEQVVNRIATLTEEGDMNPLAIQVEKDRQFWQDQGLSQEEAGVRSRYRLFGSKPGAYGAGLQGLIDSQNWQDQQDLAQAYRNWSSYAYTVNQGQLTGVETPEVFAQRLQGLQIVLQNQDNREFDILDSDDYYQFQGGLTAAVKAISGVAPQTYFGDNSLPSHPRVRQLKEEITRVYRSRVINPKWIEGVMRHGYKGAFEMSATVDFLFGYDATTNCVEDYMYQGVAEAYLFDQKVKDFIQAKNPWALRDMGERLLEAHQRGLWSEANPHTLEELRTLVNEAEGEIEGK